MCGRKTASSSSDDQRWIGRWPTIISTVALTNAVANVEAYTFNTNADLNFVGLADTAIIHGGSGDDKIDAKANAGNEYLYGNGGDDWLMGGAGNTELDGGTGADTMEGGGGNDLYHVDNVKDVVTEQMGGGFDEIQSSVSLGALAAFVEVGSLTGNANLNITGNDLFKKRRLLRMRSLP